MNKEFSISPETKSVSPYVLTWDVEDLMLSLCAVKQWRPPTTELFDEIEQELIKRLELAFPESPIVIKASSELNEQIREMVKAEKAKGLPVVTMDPFYGADIADYQLNSTRGINPDRSIEEIARPGYPPLPEQIATLRFNLGKNSSIILVDAGAYSGDSLITVTNKLIEVSVFPSVIVLGIATNDAENRLTDSGLRIITINKIDKPIDWIEARDFIPFVPLSGRVINNGLFNGISRALPYVLPDGNPGSWASIPESSVITISEFGWTASELIFAEIERLNRRRLTIGDFIGLRIRVSYPGTEQPDLKIAIRQIIAWKKARLEVNEK